MVDINRGTSGVVLPSAVSGEILSKMQEASIIQSAARRIALPGSGAVIDTITGEPTAAWVAETADKPVSNATVGAKTLRGYKLAVIETFSNEFRRDKAALYNELVNRLPLALAKKFDTTAFFGSGPGSDFDDLSGVTSIDFETAPYDALVSALQTIGVAGYDMNGIIVSPAAEALMFGAKDGNDRPLFISNAQTDGSIGAALGRPVFKSRHAAAGTSPEDTIGFAGDWSQAIWGTVEDVQIAISDQASLVSGESTINLFQQNMFAVRAEIEVGFVVGDEDAFVQFALAAA